MCKLRILFLLKENYTSGGQQEGPAKAGLLNSVEFLAHGLYKAFDIDYHIAICKDGNSIDKEVFDYKPDICILEALWYTPAKLLEIQNLHRGVLFIVRVNSKVPFLALEGMSIGWLKEYQASNAHSHSHNVILSANNFYATNDLNEVGIRTVYLPNLYPDVNRKDYTIVNKISEEARFTLNIPIERQKKTIDIGCFGAIRPLKNQLIQAFAAIALADKHRLILNFHINGSRVEQKGEEPLKNIRAVFRKSGHNLIEHPWLTHEEFLRILRDMDLGLQVSFTESFNIVTADAVSQHVPVVVSYDIDWMPDICKADPNSTEDMIAKMETLLNHRSYVINKTIDSLTKYNKKSLREWWDFLYPVEYQQSK